MLCLGLLAFAAVCGLAPGARAAVRRTPTLGPVQTTIDGPSPDIQTLDGMSVARDGTGAVVYVKTVAGVAHVFVSRLIGGTFQAPQQVDAGLPGASSEPVIAADNGGLLLVAFINAGTLYAAQAPSSGAPVGPPGVLFSGAANPSLAISPLGKAYLAFTATGAVDSVRTLYWQNGQWALSPTPLNANPLADAGDGTGRPQVAAGGDGIGIVVWGESGHVYARRVIGTTPSVSVQQADAPSVEGWGEVSATSPVVSCVGYSTYAAVAYSETIASGGQTQTRVLYARLHGETFDGSYVSDGATIGAAEGADEPQVAVTEFGVGFVTSALTSSHQLDAATLGASSGFLDGVPDLDDIEGNVHITGRTTHFWLNSGTIDASGRKIAVSDGLFLVPNANVKPTPARLTAHLAGGVEAVSDILTRDALKPYASIPLDPATLHGQVEGLVDKSLLLGKGASSAQAPLSVDAHISHFVAERLIGKENLDDADLAIKVAQGALSAKGQGRIFGAPAQFEINRVGDGPPTALISTTLDDAARAKVGLQAIPGVTGPMTAHVNASLGDPSKIKAQVNLDLTRTAVAAGLIGVTKAAGRPAKVEFTVQPGDDRVLIEPIAIDVGTLQGRGGIELDGDNAFKSAHFSSLKISPGDDMKVDVAKGEDGVKLTIRGSTIDARPFLKALTTTPVADKDTGAKGTRGALTKSSLAKSAKAEASEVGALGGIDVDLKSGILTGFNREVMSGVDLKLSKHGPQIRQFSVQGRFGRDAISGSIDPNHRVKIVSQDAGALVSFVDLYKHMEGGNLAADMTMDGDTLDGNLEIHDFVLRDEPAIRSLVARSTTVSAPGANEAAAKRINGDAVQFNRLKVTFERDGSRLQLSDATMSGPEIGLSVDGWLDYSHNRVAMNGTFVPVFALNNLFSQIPVIGAVLGGKSDEGLLAITFRISGAAASPTLTINPLSAVTPGFLRSIFGNIDLPGMQIPADGGEPASR